LPLDEDIKQLSFRKKRLSEVYGEDIAASASQAKSSMTNMWKDSRDLLTRWGRITMQVGQVGNKGKGRPQGGLTARSSKDLEDIERAIMIERIIGEDCDFPAVRYAKTNE
jgi:hypothetical protein